MTNVYIASGWFNDRQALDLKFIKSVLNTNKIKYYSPKDHTPKVNFKKSSDRSLVFTSNLIEIGKADWVIVNTRDKDMGTIFEAGYAFAINTPMLYLAIDLEGPFNLMLAESGKLVATTRDEFEKYVKKYLVHNAVPSLGHDKYVGDIE